MSLSVKDRAQRIATFRYIEVRLMETVAAWTPLVPEMEVKVLFGRHIWDFAQHADALGKRTFELRQPLHTSRAPREDYLAFLGEIADLDATDARLGGLYEVLIPGLVRRYREYLDATDHLLDAPSVVIIERILTDLERQRRDGLALRQTLGPARWKDDRFRDREAAIREITA
ncbi:MAG: hypothetical protein ACRD2J_11150 [Thermoanaerobaculia bacterium]